MGHWSYSYTNSSNALEYPILVCDTLITCIETDSCVLVPWTRTKCLKTLEIIEQKQKAATRDKYKRTSLEVVAKLKQGMRSRIDAIWLDTAREECQLKNSSKCWPSRPHTAGERLSSLATDHDHHGVQSRASVLNLLRRLGSLATRRTKSRRG